MCTREKGPGAAQTQYSELLYGFQGKAEQRGLNNTTTKKVFPPPSLFLSLDGLFYHGGAFFLDDFSS